MMGVCVVDVSMGNMSGGPLHIWCCRHSYEDNGEVVTLGNMDYVGNDDKIGRASCRERV